MIVLILIKLFCVVNTTGEKIQTKQEHEYSITNSTYWVFL
jgi:hypothetical protein